jgi:tetratricopeptide (TPR) repeat protein
VAAKIADHHDEARKAYEHALELHLEIFGEEHPETARTLGNLGSLLSAEGNHAEAESYLRRASASFEAVLGEQHPLVAVVVGNLGQNLGMQGRNREAIPLFERSLAIRQANFEPDHPLVAKSHYNLAFTLYYLHEYERALEHFERGYELASRNLGPDDKQPPASWLVFLALTHAQLGRHEEAVPWFEQALQARGEEDDYALAGLRFEAARSLIGIDPVRARQLAEQSLAALEAHAAQADDEMQAEEDRADAAQRRSWLDEHAG